jgi:cytochrome bd-type quinol oxidase subunit 2
MDKKTMKILGIVAAVVVLAVVGYLIYMYGMMAPGAM